MNFVDKDGTTKMYIPVHPWTTLMTHGKTRVDDKKSPMREVVDYILHCLSTALNINSNVGFQKLLKYMYVAGKPNSLT